MMNLMNAFIKQDILDITKVWGVNLSAIGITLWGNIIPPLQVLALLIAIGYNIWKWYRDYRKHKENE